MSCEHSLFTCRETFLSACCFIVLANNLLGQPDNILGLTWDCPASRPVSVEMSLHVHMCSAADYTCTCNATETGTSANLVDHVLVHVQR